MITRRRLLKGTAALAASALGLSGYAWGVEPYRLIVQRYGLTPPGWPSDLRLRIAALADIHTCEPWMPASRVAEIVARTNALKPDLVVLLGDFVTQHRLVRREVPKRDWAGALAELEAPLGRYAILGNHDWWEEYELQERRRGPTPVGRALEAVGIPVMENDAVRLTHGGKSFWLAGLGDQWAFWLGRRRAFMKSRFAYAGMDDLPGTLAKLTTDEPAILLAHEPDIFPQVPARFSLTLCGHTHGGQVQLFGYAPRVPSRYGRHYLYGHLREPDASGEPRDIVVSGGLGCSGLPIRFGRPPEIMLIELGDVPQDATA